MRYLSFFFFMFMLFQFGNAQETRPDFEVKILQYNEAIPIVGDSVCLLPTSFVIEVKLNATDYVFMNALASDNYFNMDSIQEAELMESIGYKIYAEYPKNQKHNIIIDLSEPYGFHYLGVESDDNNRGFNEILVAENERIGSRTVDSLFVMYNFDRRETQPINKFQEDLFLKFISTGVENNKRIISFFRNIKLVWKREK